MIKRNRKWIAVLLIVGLVISGVSVYADSSVHLMVDAEHVETLLEIRDGRTMVPVSTLQDVFDATATWEDSRLILAFAEKTMMLEEGSASAWLDGEVVELDAPWVMLNDISWVPLAAIARSFGHAVFWNAQHRTVEVMTRTNRLFSESVLAIASTGSLLLNGELGDLHEEIVASGEWDTPENEAFRTVLKEIKEINDVTYVYTLIKSGTDEEPTLLIAESDYPEEFGDEYEMEPQFLKAFSGEPAYAPHFWDEDGVVMKSAFAPIYNSAGEVVAILGIDTEYDTMNHDANALISAKVKAMASTGSLLLNGKMADLHEEILASGEWDTPENETFRVPLQQIREINDATYVYTFVWESDEEVLLISEADYPEEFGTRYDMEPQFLVAFSGTPAAAGHIWVDEESMKSAFAPIYNTSGEIVALLGIDFEAPELAYVPELE
ncbi:MAG: copper amine oxidase N-terminal domain-containing protein [Bacillota bacterium]|nr:copper amine oxidase N-terminal domain-containing protein [Bacillota bacterium]MDW7677236.1 copper amine oxidase N-terminal domain-containing protein [Bacillota bacterium]